MRDVIFIFHFGLFFVLLPSTQTEKLQFLKNEDNAWRYHHFIHVYQKLRSHDVHVQFLRYGAQ